MSSARPCQSRLRLRADLASSKASSSFLLTSLLLWSSEVLFYLDCTIPGGTEISTGCLFGWKWKYKSKSLDYCLILYFSGFLKSNSRNWNKSGGISESSVQAFPQCHSRDGNMSPLRWGNIALVLYTKKLVRRILTLQNSSISSGWTQYCQNCYSWNEALWLVWGLLDLFCETFGGAISWNEMCGCN